LVLALPSLPLAGHAAHSLTAPTNGNSFCGVVRADGPAFEEAVGVLVTPVSTDLVDVVATADVSSGATFPGLYDGGFGYTCSVTGVGSLEYGSASGALVVQASSTPDFLEGIGANAGNIFTNSGRAQGQALFELQFDDAGTVESAVLPAGTPVQLEFTYFLESVAVVVGAHGAPFVSASATYSARAVDTAAPGAPAEALLVGNQTLTRTLDTQVGRTIELQGRLSLSAAALAGRMSGGIFYDPQAQASIDASNSSHFTVELPPDVQLVTESGHDYTVPEPGHALLLASGALVLAATRPRPPGAGRYRSFAR
jgi:hypothetical protein